MKALSKKTLHIFLTVIAMSFSSIYALIDVDDIGSLYTIRSYMVTGEYYQGLNGFGFGGGCFVFQNEWKAVRLGPVYKGNFYYVTNKDSTAAIFFGLGIGLGMLIGPEKGPLSTRINFEIPVGFTNDGNFGFYWGVCSDQALAFRFGKNAKFVSTAGVYEKLIMGSFGLFPDIGARVSVGFEFGENPDQYGLNPK